MNKILALLAIAVLWASPVAAQTATPASKLAWDEVGESPAVAQAAIYNLYVDGAGVALNLTSVACVVQTSNAANATCTAPVSSDDGRVAHVDVVAGVERGGESEVGAAERDLRDRGDADGHQDCAVGRTGATRVVNSCEER
jgi:hypothetical protein